MAKHYYISFNGTDFLEIFPVNDPEATQRQIEGTRVWREEVDELRLTKTKNATVYDTLHAYFIDNTQFDTEIEIEIYSGTRATGVLYWEGLFSISDTVDNFQNTVAVLNPLRINDEYRPVLEQAERQIEIGIGAAFNLRRVGYSEPLTIGPGWTNPADGYGPLSTLDSALGGSVGTAIATDAGDEDAASVGLPAFATGDVVIIDVSGWTQNGAPRFPIFDIFGAGPASATDEGGKNIATGLLGYTLTGTQAAPRLVMRSPPNPAGTFSITDLTFTARKIMPANDHTFSGRLLMEFLNRFISEVGYMGVVAFDTNVVSTFFANNDLPVIGAPASITAIMGGEPAGNYVRGTTDNELNTAIIGLLRQWFDVPEPPSFKLSFNDIMGQLREMFQVYWFIDADGKFRLEHEMYFVALVNDSTPIVLSNYPKSEVDAREFEYNKGQIASTETFQWAQSANQDFVGEDIIYNNFETINNSKEHTPNYITTDIKYVIDNLEEASNNGLGIYQCNILTGITGADIYEIAISTGELSTNAISNAAFSWANLHEKYWSWSRMAEDATVNSAGVTMDSQVRFLEQANIRFFYATAIDPFTMITATLTGGAPIEIRRSLENDFVELIIGFDPYRL